MPGDPARPVVHLTIQSDAASVRAALRHLFGTRRLGLLPDAERDSAELVLAEVLNNIVEHGQSGSGGSIELTIRQTVRGLECTVVDGSVRMPGNAAPAGQPPDLTRGDLPEGGFGWHLIRLLATDLDYRRVGNQNQLSFRLLAEQSRA